MRAFTFEAHIPRTILGSGTISRIPDEIRRLNVERVLLITESTDRQLALSKTIGDSLGSHCAGVCADAVMHTPLEVTEKALETALQVHADSLVSIGGGSTIGLGKALAVRMNVPHVAVPTTYAGSEATPILGETVNGEKKTRSDPRILPTTIIYDIDLTLSLPLSLTFTSGINAIAHCVEALHSEQINPLIESLALQGISSLYSSLQILKDAPNNMDARGQATTGAWAAGICLGHVGMALHHKLCHTLGGTFGLPHSETHTVMLPYAMAYNAEAASCAMRSISNAIGYDGNAAKAIWELERSLGTVRSLQDLGMKKDDLVKAATLAGQSRYPNPAPLEHGKLLNLLENAFYGRPPI